MIIAGGAGTRLWPLSQADTPKHLLSLIGKQSLLQDTYKRSAAITKNIYVITEASHAEEVRKQLPKLKPDRVIAEPARRGTASCILLALAHLKNRIKPGEPVVFLHADHHITDTKSFAQAVRFAAEGSVKYQKITLIGLRPTYPATGFGYIQVGKKVEQKKSLHLNKTLKFVEKPDAPTAGKYLRSGDYLWNLGLFTAPIEVFESEIRICAPSLWAGYQKITTSLGNTRRLQRTYLSLKTQPIDTALIEKTAENLVVPGSFGWADIGSFLDLHKILKGRKHNSLKGDVQLIDCEDSMIHGSGKPIVAIGLSGIVVVDTPDGLLVCAKEKSQLVGEAAKQLQKRAKETKR